MPSIDQNTAQRGIEPSRTLKRFRMGDNGALFGQNVVPEVSQSGEIRVGMRVYLKSIRSN
jgi:uncharacterized protein YcbX